MAENFKEVTAVWRGDMKFDAVASNGSSVPMESGKFTPMDMLLGGLAGCSGLDVIDILRKKRQEVTAFEVLVHGDRATEHPMKYTGYTIKYIITGHNVDEAAVKRAIELSETKYCGAMATLRQSGPVTTSYEIRAAEPSPAA